MRILLFTTAYRPLVGGSELAIENIARRMPDVVFDILTPRYRPGLPPSETTGNVNVHRIGSGWRGDKWFFPVLGFFYARKLLYSQRYDLVHAYQASHAAGAAFLVKMFMPRVRFLVTLQEGKELTRQFAFIRLFRRFIIERADGATVISGYLKRFVESIRTDLEVRVIPNGVDVKHFAGPASSSFQQEARSKFGLESTDHVLISVSRLVEKNGLADLLRAVPHIRSDRPVKLLLAGDGELRGRLTALARELGIADRVFFLGTVPHSKLPQYLSLADVFVRPSLSEGLGNAFLEAMAAGVPIVACQTGGIADFLVPGRTGMACDPGSPESIARAIERILNDQTLRANMIANGRSLVAGKYTWDIVASEMRRVYTEMSANA